MHIWVKLSCYSEDAALQDFKDLLQKLAHVFKSTIIWLWLSDILGGLDAVGP